jgi:hypothetical protein
MAAVQLWCRVRVVRPDGSELAACELHGPGDADLKVVDDVARITLMAGRLGGRIVLSEVSATLRDLLELAGLGVEMERQTELGEETLWVQERQEERHPGDLAP